MTQHQKNESCEVNVEPGNDKERGLGAKALKAKKKPRSSISIKDGETFNEK
jgi:hypothetical protein